MEGKISQNSLTEFYNKEIKSFGKKTLEDMLESSRVSSNKINKKSVFLSHSHFDKTIVQKIGLLFNSMNAELYIDWMDNSLPKLTNTITAQLIKRKISECDNFLFLATYNGLRSKWCNWELGIADTLKYERMAILPIESKSGKWEGNEYLNLYPEMIISDENLDVLTTDKIEINQIDGRRIAFNEWLGKK